MQPQHALVVQPQQELKLGRHGVEHLLGLHVVVVVVGERVRPVRVGAEGPEAVQVHVGAHLQRQADHDQAGAHAHGPQALRAPELGQLMQVVGVEEDQPGGTAEVLDGVEGPHGHGRVEAVGEGGHEQHGVAVGAQALHERTPTAHQGAVPEGEAAAQTGSEATRRKLKECSEQRRPLALTYPEGCWGWRSPGQS